MWNIAGPPAIDTLSASVADQSHVVILAIVLNTIAFDVRAHEWPHFHVNGKGWKSTVT